MIPYVPTTDNPFYIQSSECRLCSAKVDGGPNKLDDAGGNSAVVTSLGRSYALRKMQVWSTRSSDVIFRTCCGQMAA